MSPAVDRFFHKLVGLFVDDWWFALSIAGWLLLTGLLLPALGLAAIWSGVILFAGLAAVLIESVRRRAKA